MRKIVLKLLYLSISRPLWSYHEPPPKYFTTTLKFISQCFLVFQCRSNLIFSTFGRSSRREKQHERNVIIICENEAPCNNKQKEKMCVLIRKLLSNVYSKLTQKNASSEYGLALKFCQLIQFGPKKNDDDDENTKSSS